MFVSRCKEKMRNDESRSTFRCTDCHFVLFPLCPHFLCRVNRKRERRGQSASAAATAAAILSMFGREREKKECGRLQKFKTSSKLTKKRGKRNGRKTTSHCSLHGVIDRPRGWSLEDELHCGAGAYRPMNLKQRVFGVVQIRVWMHN